MGKGVGMDLSLPIAEEIKAVLFARLKANSDPLGDGCWLWLGSTRNGQHGQISVHDRPVYVHQLSYAIHHGPIPRGKVVRHNCDVPLCWRPDHLRLGVQLENVADMHERGRAKRPPRLAGVSHPMATLTDDQVKSIRERWSAGGIRQRDLAMEFHVSQSTVWRLVHGITRAPA